MKNSHGQKEMNCHISVRIFKDQDGSIKASFSHWELVSLLDLDKLSIYVLFELYSHISPVWPYPSTNTFVI